MRSPSQQLPKNSRFAHKLITLFRLSCREKIWVMLIYFLSGLVSLALVVFPFRFIAYALGTHYKNHQLSTLVPQPLLDRAWRVGRLVEGISRYTPWQSKCLVQAITVIILLRYYGIPYVFHLGTRFTRVATAPMKGHAWVKVGPWIIVGRDGHKQYTIVSSFVCSSLLNNSDSG